MNLWFRLGIAVLEGPMYAVGGHDGWSYLNTVERWDPQARQWNYVASMSTPRSTMGVTALNGKYVPPNGFFIIWAAMFFSCIVQNVDHIKGENKSFQ